MVTEKYHNTTIIDKGPPAAQPVPLYYRVLLKKVRSKQRVTISLQRNNKTWQLGSINGKTGEIHLLSKHTGQLLDEEDIQSLLAQGLNLLNGPKNRVDYEAAGTIELHLFLKDSRVEVHYKEGNKLAEWSVSNGLQFFGDVHPIFRKDKLALAQACLELTQSGGGIFSSGIGQNQTIGGGILSDGGIL